jgi:RND family efflux transporter MFP subunit
MIFKNLRSSFILAGLLILTASCSNSDNTSGERPQSNAVIPAVEAVEARFGALPLVERFSGNVRAENQVPLFPEITGVIETVYVENGDYVTKGQKLIELDDRQIKQQLQQAEAGLRISQARLKQAKANYNELDAQYQRTKKLADKELSSQLELEQLSAQLQSAEANIELAQAELDQSLALVNERKEQMAQTIIRAPIEGTIGQRNAQVGMQVNNATQLFMLGDLSKLRVEIVLTESMLNKIQEGQRAQILVTDENGNKRAINAELSRISPFLNEITRSTEAEIDLENRDNLLKPGMFVPVDVFFGESQQATLIPESAIFTDPTSGKVGVYVVSSIGTEIEPVSESEDDTPSALTSPTPVSFKEINIIARGRMQVGVSGVESGQWVVTIGQDLLSEGREQARVRTSSWDKIMRLQSLQREDLLDEVMKEKENRQPQTTL